MSDSNQHSRTITVPEDALRDELLKLIQERDGLKEQLESYAGTLRQLEAMKPDRMTREDFAEALGIARNLAWKALNPAKERP